MRHSLAEAIQQLREYMFGGASAFPGPEPGTVWNDSGYYPGSAADKAIRDPDAEKQARMKRKKREFQSQLRQYLRQTSVGMTCRQSQ